MSDEIVELEEDLSGSPLYSEDLAPVPAGRRTWSMLNLAAIWVGMAVCIPTYILASYMIKSGLSWYVALIIIAIANLIITVPMVLNGHAGVKYGIPFPVLGRASFGYKGIHIASVLRAIVACGWFGVQTWIGGLAFYAIWNALTGVEGNADLDAGKFVGFGLFWLVNVFFIWRGTESIKWLEDFSAPILVLIGALLIIWGYNIAGGFGIVLDQSRQLEKPVASLDYEVGIDRLVLTLNPLLDKDGKIKATHYQLTIPTVDDKEKGRWIQIKRDQAPILVESLSDKIDRDALIAGEKQIAVQFRDDGEGDYDFLYSSTVSIPVSKTRDGAPASNLWLYLIWLTAMVGFWATMAISIADITRYASSQDDQVKGQFLGLPGTMLFYSFVGVFVTCAAVIGFKDVLIADDAPWDPVTLLSKFDNAALVIVSQVFMVIATLSTNIAANVIAPSNAFSNLFPKQLSFRGGGMVTAIIGILICPWWVLGHIEEYLILVSGLLGPVLAIFVCDYYLLRKKNLILPDLYKTQGAYTYSNGFNSAAIAAFLFGGFFAIAGRWIGVLERLYSLSWFSGFIIAFAVYYLLMKVRTIMSVTGLVAAMLILTLSGDAQPVNDNIESATEITDLLHWCSPIGGLNNTGATEDRDKIGCMEEIGPNYNTWFKFRASTENVQVVVSAGDEFGTMRFACVALFDEYGEQLACDAYDDEYGDVGLTYTNLNLGNWYFIQVDHPNMSKYTGSFTLCVNDELGYDFQDGAKELMNLSSWCSRDGEFTTAKGSPDGGTGKCLKSGPNFNKWFKFYARSDRIEVKVASGGEQGTCKFPCVMLWDAGFNELACASWKPEAADECTLSAGGLKEKNWYYISVDHLLNKDYPGSFTLCVNNGVTDETEAVREKIAIRGRLLYNLYEPVSSKITLLGDHDEVLAESTTDKSGKFRFDDLAPEVDYTVVVEDYIPGQDVAIVQTNFEGRIIKKAYREERNVFRFNLLPPDCFSLGLLSCEDPGLLPDAGMVGVLGVVASKGDPLGGKGQVNIGLYTDIKTLIRETHTDKQGRFKFNNLKFKAGYLVKVGDASDDLYVEMLMVNDEGNSIMASTMDNLSPNGFFSFRELPYMSSGAGKLSMENLSELKMVEMPAGATVRLDNVYFASGDYSLRPESGAELEDLVALLNEKKDIRIELAGHTDNIGTAQYNLLLSANRAKAVMDYLISKGISSTRLTYKGYGSKKPVSKDGSEPERMKDRRVEFRVIP